MTRDIGDDAQEQLLYLRPNDIGGVEVLIARRSSRRWHVIHETYAFCACGGSSAGVAGWRYRGKTHFAINGSVMLLEPGEVHSNTEVVHSANFKVVFVPANEMENAARELGLPGTPHFEIAQSGDPRLFAAIYGFAESVESGATILQRQSLLEVLLRRLLCYAEHKPRPAEVLEPRAIARAKACLQERCSEPVTLDELCAAAGGVSRFGLVRSFSSQMGLPPHAYQIHVRIARARQLLGKGVPPALVAAELGFSDQSHFTRHFKDILGVTPGEYILAGRDSRSARPFEIKQVG